MEQLGWKGCSEQGCDGEENFELQDSGIHSLLCKSLQVCLSFELRLKISRKQNLIQRENLSGKLKRCILGSQHGFGLTIHGVVMSFRILFAKKKKRKKKIPIVPPKTLHGAEHFAFPLRAKKKELSFTARFCDWPNKVTA